MEWSEKKRHGLLYGQAQLLWQLQQAYRKKKGRRAGSEEGLRVLEEIYGQAQAKVWYRRYAIQKNEKLLAVFWTGMGLSAALFLAPLVTAGKSTVTALKRPPGGEQSAVYALKVQADEEQIGGVELTVPQRQLTAEQRRQLLLRGQEEWEACMEEQGWQPDAVTKDLHVPDTLCDGLVEVRLESSNYDLLDGTGHVRNALVEESGELVQLSVILSCGADRKILSCPVRILPEGQEMTDRLTRFVMRQIAEEESQEESEIVLLPDEFEGKKLTWQTARPSYGGWIALLSVLGCAVLNAAFEQDLRKEGKKRRDELLRVYPAFLSRLILLAGTGMPLRNIFLRMAKKAEEENAPPVYEEVWRTCREMESGVTQLHAYENFGRRCRLPQYKKCASLLAQNVRKGSSGMLAALNQEAVNAFEERKALARKKGEEAQTKLLLPMLMMLMVVMILIMVPACFSFGGW